MFLKVHMKGSIKNKWILYLGIAFLVVLVGLLVYDLVRKGIYSHQVGINIAVVGDSKVSVLLLRPEEDLISWISLPSDVRVKIHNSSAHYPVGSLWKYGSSERKPYDVVEKSLGQSMGVLVVKTIKLDKDAEIEDVLGSLLSPGLKTNLSIRDRVLIRSFLIDAVKSKKVLELSLPSSVFETIIDPDGKEFREFNSAVSLWAKNKFVLEAVLSENTDISINNASNIVGAGILFAHQIESAGLHVVEVKADKEEKVVGKGCVFYSSWGVNEVTEQVLISQAGCSKIAKPEFLENDDKLRIWIND